MQSNVWTCCRENNYELCRLIKRFDLVDSRSIGYHYKDMLSMLKLRILSVILVVAGLVSGCGTPVLNISEPSKEEKSSARQSLGKVKIPPPRRIPASEMQATIERVEDPIRKAAFEICHELILPEERCQNVLASDLKVMTKDQDMNAYADYQNNVGFTGGMIHYSGSDEELAAVYAHELAHVMYGHVEKKINNTLMGMIIGGGIGLVLASNAGPYYDDQISYDLINAGAAIGSVAYSPEMEIESDRTAIYILEEAGYPPDSMRDVIVRLHRHQDGTIGGHSNGVGFLQTHPSNDRRIAHILSSIDDVKSGVPLRLK